MKTHDFLRLRSALFVGAWLVVGCAHKEHAMTSRELFAMVEIGMSRSDVDALLGAPGVPQLSSDGEVWYLPPPPIEPHDSPFAPGTIGVRFASDGTVASKRLNPQFRE
jgi:hypothetical protein